MDEERLLLPTYIHLDLLDWQSTYFELDLDEVIVPIHEAAITRLQEIHSDAERVAQEKIREAELADQEDEHQFARDLAEEEENRARERERVVGWLALMNLVMVFHLKLSKLLEVLTRIAEARGIRASAPQGKSGNTGWLRSLSDEYSQIWN